MPTLPDIATMLIIVAVVVWFGGWISEDLGDALGVPSFAGRAAAADAVEPVPVSSIASIPDAKKTPSAETFSRGGTGAAGDTGGGNTLHKRTPNHRRPREEASK